MKFLLIVLAIHFIGEVIAGKRKTNNDNRDDDPTTISMHPAEYALR